MPNQDLGTLHITGAASMTDASKDADHAAASVVGTAVFFVNPSLITLQHFFKPTQVVSAPTPTTVPVAKPGNPTTHYTIQTANKKPPKSGQGGVPVVG